MGTFLGRQPILWTAAFGQLISLAVLFYNLFKPAGSPEIDTSVVIAINAAFAGMIVLVANSAVTPTGDARLANGTQVNSGTSVVVPQSTVTGSAASILQPPATDNE